jgi:hypothetical protein
MPNNFQKVSLAPPENVEIAGVRIALQCLLHKHRKRAESLSHIRVARRQPHPNAAWKGDHLSMSFARPEPASAPITLASVVSSGEPSIAIRTLAPKAIVIAARGRPALVPALWEPPSQAQRQEGHLAPAPTAVANDTGGFDQSRPAWLPRSHWRPAPSTLRPTLPFPSVASGGVFRQT